MATENQLRANRENAQRSTGPKTPEGNAAANAKSDFTEEIRDLYLEYRESVEAPDSAFNNTWPVSKQTAFTDFQDKFIPKNLNKFEKTRPRTPNDARRARYRMAMATENQLRANRENALRSTGPKTPEGKAASSSNALRHGFSASTIDSFPEEIRELYLEYRESVEAEFLPGTETEKIYFEQWAFAQFLFIRSQSAEAVAQLNQSVHPGDPLYSSELLKIARYTRGLASAADRAKRNLQEAQANRHALIEIQDIVTHSKNSDVAVPTNAPLHKMIRKGYKSDSDDIALRIIHAEMTRRFVTTEAPKQNEANLPPLPGGVKSWLEQQMDSLRP